MVEFVQTHTQHATVATAGYAALVTNPKERKFTARELEQAVEEGIQAYLSKIGRAGRNPPRLAAHRDRNPPFKKQRIQATVGNSMHIEDNDEPKYCFMHGKNRSHAGKECHTMRNTAKYTEAMKHATVPCTVSGVAGSTLGY